MVRWERVKVSESRILAREGGSERQYGEKRMDSTVKEGKFQGKEGGQAKRIILKVGRSMSG